ncbi:hypothetical protein M0802_000721 [Mischocyttarus mexicanus]|nr:hypothetical protein M0802_000721 [Mischocyttarus mexicanus]
MVQANTKTACPHNLTIWQPCKSKSSSSSRAANSVLGLNFKRSRDRGGPASLFCIRGTRAPSDYVLYGITVSLGGHIARLMAVCPVRSAR